VIEKILIGTIFGGFKNVVAGSVLGAVEVLLQNFINRKRVLLLFLHILERYAKMTQTNIDDEWVADIKKDLIEKGEI